MRKALEKKIETAKEAISKVHSDRSGPAEDNVEALKELKEHIEMLIDTLDR